MQYIKYPEMNNCALILFNLDSEKKIKKSQWNINYLNMIYISVCMAIAELVCMSTETLRFLVLRR
jgi:hypothetical protein